MSSGSKALLRKKNEDRLLLLFNWLAAGSGGASTLSFEDVVHVIERMQEMKGVFGTRPLMATADVRSFFENRLIA